MLYRLMVVLMLALFPLQWSVAQVHELSDDMSIVRATSGDPVQVNSLLTHTNEPGGLCQFHQLSQVFADLSTPNPLSPPIRINEGWKLIPGLTIPESYFLSEIDKPKWTVASPPAAVS